MTTLKKFSLLDIFEYSGINLDILTETFGDNFYGKYIAKWQEYCVSLFNGSNQIVGYLMGKVEGQEQDEDWHGHVTCVTVSPQARRQGIAKNLMDYLESVSENIHNAFYVDLFVRKGNDIAIKMYKKLGYDIFQVVDKYYSACEERFMKSEDAYDMRKSLKRDTTQQFVKPTGRTIKPNELKYH